MQVTERAEYGYDDVEAWSRLDCDTDAYMDCEGVWSVCVEMWRVGGSQAMESR